MSINYYFCDFSLIYWKSSRINFHAISWQNIKEKNILFLKICIPTLKSGDISVALRYLKTASSIFSDTPISSWLMTSVCSVVPLYHGSGFDEKTCKSKGTTWFCQYRSTYTVIFADVCILMWQGFQNKYRIKQAVLLLAVVVRCTREFERRMIDGSVCPRPYLMTVLCQYHMPHKIFTYTLYTRPNDIDPKSLKIKDENKLKVPSTFTR